jgi:hypothetical protein
VIYYEISTVATPGKTQELLGHVAEYNRIIAAHGAKSLGSFVVGVGDNVGTIKHIVGYADQGAAEAARQKLQSDPDWQKLSDATFPIISSYSITLLEALPGSAAA